MTPDYYFPGVGSLVQAKLGLGNIPALDIRQQCSGFIYGLQVCDALLRAGVAKKLLFIGAEIHSGFMPFSKHGWDVVMGKLERAGDAAGARLEHEVPPPHGALRRRGGRGVHGRRPTTPSAGLLGFSLHSDGKDVESLYVPSAGFKPTAPTSAKSTCARAASCR